MQGSGAAYPRPDLRRTILPVPWVRPCCSRRRSTPGDRVHGRTDGARAAHYRGRRGLHPGIRRSCRRSAAPGNPPAVPVRAPCLSGPPGALNCHPDHGAAAVKNRARRADRTRLPGNSAPGPRTYRMTPGMKKAPGQRMRWPRANSVFAPPTGLEPVTLRLTVECSAN